MAAVIVERQEDTVTIQIQVKLSRSMLDSEEAIQRRRIPARAAEG